MSVEANEIWDILKENSLQIGRLQSAQLETDRILKELSAEIKETSREIKENSREIKEVHKELSAEIKETQKITAREIKAVNTSIGRLSNRLGEFVEEAVRPSAVRLFRERGIDIHEVQQSITAKRDGEQLEIDLLVVNNENVVVIECKSNLSVEDVNDHLERLEKVKRLLPRYNNCKVLGAVAGMVIPDNVATYAIKKGLYVIGQNGDHLELRNEQSFTPKAW
jgi:hypothetical protein